MKPLIQTLLASAAAVLAVPATAQEVVLKFHHIWPPAAMAPTRVIAPWCDKIAADSNGRMKCQVLHAMSGAFDLRVPLEVNLSHGASWAAAKG